MITIANKIKPFSHSPGAACLIPGTSYLVQAFPTQVKVQDLEGNVIKEVTFDIEGPLKQFTLTQDLERGCVTIHSEVYRCHLLPNLELRFSKQPGADVKTEHREFLSLGSHKKQEWEAIKKRVDCREIFPLWFRLGSLLKLSERKSGHTGMFTLLKKCEEAIASHRPETIVPAFHRLFLAGFHSMLIPRVEDLDHQGILSSTEISTHSPLYLLQEGAKLIRSLFLVDSGNEIAILPNLPPECFAGRMLNLNTRYGVLDLEWSKKSIRRLIFRATSDGEVHFHFHASLKCFRLCKKREMRCGEPFEIKSGSLYLLDQFEK